MVSEKSAFRAYSGKPGSFVSNSHIIYIMLNRFYGNAGYCDLEVELALRF